MEDMRREMQEKQLFIQQAIGFAIHPPNGHREHQRAAWCVPFPGLLGQVDCRAFLCVHLAAYLIVYVDEISGVGYSGP